MQLEWAHRVVEHSDKPVLILAPLAVTQQTKEEGEKFGIDVQVVRDGSHINGPAIYCTNYDMLKAFDPSMFGGVVLDESSILKSFTGATKNLICQSFDRTPFRLACTATPAPNDYLELGNHAQFLGVMDSSEMISRWFLNDSMKAGGYRLKRHAEHEYWRWVASWAKSLDKPSDLGYSDEGFILPPLDFIEHIVRVDQTEAAGDRLIRNVDLSGTGLHREMRLTAPYRADRVAELVASDPSEPWVIWCNTDYEADELRHRMPGAVEVRGNEKPEAKEQKLNDFSHGRIHRLITKPSIAGFGLNWQHCARMAFVGLSYSFEQLYQAIRRTWRYGQTRRVQAHLVVAETEGAVLETIRTKQRQHERMKQGMVNAMRQVELNIDGLDYFAPKAKVEVPSWLA